MMNDQRQRGFSMIELMVALVLGLMVVSAVLQVFVAGKRSYQMQEDLSRIQENGRFSMEFLKRDIRGADFWGCLTGIIGNIQNNLNFGTDPLFTFTNGVGGAEGGAGASFAYSSNTTPVVYSDYLILRGGTGGGLKVVPPYMPNSSATVKIENDSELAQGDVILLSDCKAGDIFQITNSPTSGNSPGHDEVNHNSGGGNPGNANSSLSKSYQGDARIFKAGSTTYDIQVGAGGEPALYRNDTNELVEGVESMQLRFGVDEDGNDSPDYYETADILTATDMDKVISIQVSVLMRGLADNVTSEPMTFEYAGQTLTANDRRLRKVFTSTVALRNRLN